MKKALITTIATLLCAITAGTATPQAKATGPAPAPTVNLSRAVPVHEAGATRGLPVAQHVRPQGWSLVCLLLGICY